MSDLDRENLRDESAPLTKKNKVVNDSEETGNNQEAKSKKKKIIWGAVIILVIIGVILAIVLPLTLGGDNGGGGGDGEDPFSNPEFNIYSVDQSSYASTVWKAEFTLKQNKYLTIKPQSAFMKLQDSLNGGSYTPVNPQNIVNASNNLWANYAKFNIDLVDNYQARVFIRNNQSSDDTLRRQMVNETVFNRPVQAWEARLSQLDFKVSNESFGFSFGNIYTNETIISTKNRKMLVSDQYSEIGFVLPSKRCFGLGQRNGQFQLSQGMYTLHARGRSEALPMDAQLGDTSGNHIHPFVLCQTQETKDFFGMFFVSNAPQVFEIVQFAGQDKQVLNYITLGGPLEIYFIMRGKPQEIIQKYHAMIGNSQMPPYYALGVFQGSGSYSTWDQVSTVFSSYTDAKQALEGVLIENYNTQPHYSYSVNETNFPDLATQVAAVHAKNQKMIFGTSYAPHNSHDNLWYNKTIEYLALIDSSNIMFPGQCVTGILDNTTVQYFDPFTTGAQGFLQEALSTFNTTIGTFDGIVVQDSYLPNHINGEIDPSTVSTPNKRRMLTVNEESVGTYQPYFVNQTEASLPSTYDMAFLPHFKTSVHLDNMTISLNATQGGNAKVPNQFVHNAVSHRSLQKTYAALTNNSDSTTKRPLLLTDASWAGSGAYSVALITNIYRNWDSLRYIIDQAFALSMYGMSNTMVDVCGSLGPLDEELCARYMQLAAFLPMARNYYNATYKDAATGIRMKTPGSEPYNFQSANTNYSVAYGGALSDRLKYTRYIYSQMYSSYRDGGSLVRPLFFDYPLDDQAFNNLDSTYMLGDSIKVSPVLEQGKKDGDTYSVYFPAGVWIDLNNHTKVMNLTTGQQVSLTASFAQTNAHLKGGKIIPFQANTNSYLTTTDLQVNHKMSFKIARDSGNAYADGYVQIDDGISQRSYVDEQYTFWKLRYAEKSINFWVQYGNFEYEPAGLSIHQLERIEILNAEDLNETDFACYLGRSLDPVNLTIDYKNDTKVLTLSTDVKTNVTFKDIGFIKFGNKAKEPNFCEKSTAFTYAGAKNDSVSNDTYWLYNITSKQGNELLDSLIVEYWLLDDSGTINVEFTTLADFNSNKTMIYRVPTPQVYDLTAYQAAAPTKKLSDFVIATADPFSYAIYKDTTDTTTKLWESDSTHLYFTQYFIMDSGIFTANKENGKPLLGMGERAGSVFYKNEQGGIHSRYTFDQANPIDDGLPPGRNFYGYQPFYAFQSQSTDWFGVFDVNSYATDYILYSDIGNDQTQIHKIAIGGTINKFFFVGAKIDDVIRKYQKLVGNPTVPPMWAFGWQQSRFGYVTSQDWYQVYENYTKVFDIPIDVMWADIDYLDDYKLFTIAPQSYGDLPAKVQQIKNDSRYFVPIMDAGVAVRENIGYKALEDGKKNDVFIKTSNQSGYLTAGVWCGNAYFPDFFKDSAVQWWKDSFEYLYNDTADGGLGLKFDGVWLDENEATNFCNGYCKPEERPTDSLRNKPFYVPGWRDLEDKALGVDGYHSQIKRHEYDVHNLFPLMQSKATAEFLINKLSAKKNARPYVLSRSNFPGIGKYAHHWMGDNWSTVDYMAVSVDGVYSYNLFGLPFMGSDICGFNGDAAPDLCTKWHQLGSLYPFARNHNQNASASQEPYRFNTTISPTSTVTYTDIMKTALVNRYSLIKYYYSAFHQIGAYGGSFFKPLFYEFQDDVNTFNDLDLKNNILLGEALKASIQVQTLNFTATPTTDFYFPAGKWCQIIPYVDSSKCWDTTTTGGASKTQTLNSGLEDYYVHIRGGYIVPFQNATSLKVRKTKDLEANPTDLIILPLDKNTDLTLLSGQYTGSAVGYVYFDDGITNEDISRFDIYLSNNGDSTFTLNVKSITSFVKRGLTHENVGSILFMGASKSGMDKLNTATITVGGAAKALNAPTYDAATDVLTLTVTDVDKTAFSFFDFTMIALKTV